VIRAREVNHGVGFALNRSPTGKTSPKIRKCHILLSSRSILRMQRMLVNERRSERRSFLELLVLGVRRTKTLEPEKFSI
jgi:hypothetical protein